MKKNLTQIKNERFIVALKYVDSKICVCFHAYCFNMIVSHFGYISYGLCQLCYYYVIFHFCVRRKMKCVLLYSSVRNWLWFHFFVLFRLCVAVHFTSTFSDSRAKYFKHSLEHSEKCFLTQLPVWAEKKTSDGNDSSLQCMLLTVLDILCMDFRPFFHRHKWFRFGFSVPLRSA